MSVYFTYMQDSINVYQNIAGTSGSWQYIANKFVGKAASKVYLVGRLELPAVMFIHPTDTTYNVIYDQGEMYGQTHTFMEQVSSITGEYNTALDYVWAAVDGASPTFVRSTTSIDLGISADYAIYFWWSDYVFSMPNMDGGFGFRLDNTLNLPNPKLGNSEQHNIKTRFKKSMGGDIKNYKRTNPSRRFKLDFEVFSRDIMEQAQA